MTNETSSSYFKHLTSKEKASKIHQLARDKGEMILWEKGKSERLKLNTYYYDKDKNKLFAVYKNNNLVGKQVLYSFMLNGINFFGKATLASENSDLIITCSEDIYKTERRKNFRLLTYPAHEVYLGVKMIGYAEQSNVIQMQTGMSQTGLFKNFLNLLGDEQTQLFQSGYVPVRIQDISVTGLSFIIGDLEKDFFEQDSKTGKIFVDFRNGFGQLEIEDSKIIYVIESISGMPNTKAYKIGLNFLNVSESLDGNLSANINSLIRITDDKEFEDFIK